MEDDFIKRQGLPFLAHLLRRLSDQFVAGAGEWEAECGIVAPPRTASTLRLLDEKGAQSVTEIAAVLQQSHPLIITWLRRLRELGLVTASADPEDARRSLISLTRAGHREAKRMRDASDVIGRAYQQLIDETGVDLFGALWRIEEQCARTPFLEQLRDEQRRSSNIDNDPA